MRQIVNGIEIDVPTSPDGAVSSDVIRQVARIPKDRVLIAQYPNGQNQIVNPGEQVHLPYDCYLTDAPSHIRGGGE
jgi:hypothetical protein